MYNKIYLPLLFILFLCFSCAGSPKKKAEKIVKAWNNKEILFPQNIVFTRFIEDTVAYGIPNTTYKINYE